MGKSKSYKAQESAKHSVSEPLAEYCSSPTMDRNMSVGDSTIYWNMLKDLSAEIKLELISKLSASLLTKESTSEKVDWTSQFAGEWKDSRSADDIIEDIRSARSANWEVEL